jgi:hypothetical protein
MYRVLLQGLRYSKRTTIHKLSGLGFWYPHPDCQAVPPIVILVVPLFYSDDVDGFVVLVGGRATNISEIPSASVFRLDCPKRRYRSGTDFGRWILVAQWSNASRRA